MLAQTLTRPLDNAATTTTLRLPMKKVKDEERSEHVRMILCYRLSKRINCFTPRTGVPAIWSGVVSPTMHVSFMTLISAKAQVAFRL